MCQIDHLQTEVTIPIYLLHGLEHLLDQFLGTQFVPPQLLPPEVRTLAVACADLGMDCLDLGYRRAVVPGDVLLEYDDDDEYDDACHCYFHRLQIHLVDYKISQPTQLRVPVDIFDPKLRGEQLTERKGRNTPERRHKSRFQFRSCWLSNLESFVRALVLILMSVSSFL